MKKILACLLSLVMLCSSTAIFSSACPKLDVCNPSYHDCSKEEIDGLKKFEYVCTFPKEKKSNMIKIFNKNYKLYRENSSPKCENDGTKNLTCHLYPCLNKAFLFAPLFKDDIPKYANCSLTAGENLKSPINFDYDPPKDTNDELSIKILKFLKKSPFIPRILFDFYSEHAFKIEEDFFIKHQKEILIGIMATVVTTLGATLYTFRNGIKTLVKKAANQVKNVLDKKDINENKTLNAKSTL